jgi:hypothetical protein
MRARTTEEIAADRQLKDALGDQHIDPLIQLLATADRWKFASAPENGPSESLHEDLSRWEGWHKTFLAELPTKR